MSALVFLASAFVLYAAGTFLAIILGKKADHTFYSGILFAGGCALVTAAIFGLTSNLVWEAPSPIYFAVAPLANKIDALSSLFIGLLGAVSLACSLFSPSYLNHFGDRLHHREYWACLFLFMTSMTQVILSANAITFLVFWELMSLSSVALVASDHANSRAPHAALIYLGATRVATAALAGGFLWMHYLTKSWSFSDWSFASITSLVPAFILLIGLCIKSGAWPFHIWLPYAHPAAPSPVSALMSGVMIKVAIYALIRLLVFGGASHNSITYLMLFLGIVSAFWGVLFALTQRDLKRLLAYSSIENIGLILMSLAVCLYCRNANLPQLAAIALAAALFHSINHGLFKSLMFLGAGAVDAGAGTRDLEQLGGLSAKMPWTFAGFLIGGAAVCSLPPLNGFASKWLLYQSLFGLAVASPLQVTKAGALASIGVLSLVGGLALAAFTKAIGITFLGKPRVAFVQHAHEGSLGIKTAQIVLAFCCIALGVAVPFALQVLNPICQSALISNHLLAYIDITKTFSIPQGLLAAILVTTALLTYKLVLQEKRKVKNYITWDCGYGEHPARAQATASSFAQPVEHIFSTVLQYQMMLKLTGKDWRHFPEHVKVQASLVPFLESRVYGPAINALEWLGKRFTRIQAGSIHLYLLYMLVTLVLLMVIGITL